MVVSDTFPSSLEILAALGGISIDDGTPKSAALPLIAICITIPMEEEPQL